MLLRVKYISLHSLAYHFNCCSTIANLSKKESRLLNLSWFLNKLVRRITSLSLFETNMGVEHPPLHHWLVHFFTLLSLCEPALRLLLLCKQAKSRIVSLPPLRRTIKQKKRSLFKLFSSRQRVAGTTRVKKNARFHRLNEQITTLETENRAFTTFIQSLAVNTYNAKQRAKDILKKYGKEAQR